MTLSVSYCFIQITPRCVQDYFYNLIIYIMSSDEESPDPSDISDFLLKIDKMESNELAEDLKNNQKKWEDMFYIYLSGNINDANEISGNRKKMGDLQTKQNQELATKAAQYLNEIFNGIELIKKNNNKIPSQQLYDNIRDFVIGYLIDKGITYEIPRKDPKIETLKRNLQTYITNHNQEPILYTMKINENDSGLNIEMQYTELGALIMWKSEIQHDFNNKLDKNLFAQINTEINNHIKNLSNLLKINEKEVNYNENIVSALCLDILNYKGISRFVQKNDETILQTGSIEPGHSIFPSIYNKDKVILTSDANNTSNVEFSQINNEKFYNITNKDVPFLNIDAGSAPTQIGFQEYAKRTAELKEMAEDHTTMKYNKPIDITVKNPTGTNMLNILSNDLNGYDVKIYSSDSTYTKRFVNNLSITNVTEIVNDLWDKKNLWYNDDISGGKGKSAKKSYISAKKSSKSAKKSINVNNAILNAVLLKSLGDLIPYQTVCLRTALIDNEDAVNVMGSIDYSMIFQLLGKVTYFKDGSDVTTELNQHRILTGVNLENSNVYFPWSDTEKLTHRILFEINQPSSDLKTVFITVKNNVVNLLNAYICKHNLPDKAANFLSTTCISNLQSCSELLSPSEKPATKQELNNLYPNINGLLTNLLDNIKPLYSKNNYKIQKSYSNDTFYSVNIDNLDYILARIIADAWTENTSIRKLTRLVDPEISKILNNTKNMSPSQQPSSPKKRKRKIGGYGKRNKTRRNK